ncbi:hypothetical protein IBTHAUMO2_20014 [Nitrosopumilaceae archaeon]|nr:hypothetical protein IBTHAUMO2_20014 [Nitrosopumilaceae archaeon]
MDIDKNILKEKISLFIDKSKTLEDVKETLGVRNTMIKVGGKMKAEFDVAVAIKRLRNEVIMLQDKTSGTVDEVLDSYIKTLYYRPFDVRYLFFSDHVVARTRISLGSDKIGDNYCLCFPRSPKKNEYTSILVSKGIISNKFADSTETSHMYPIKLNKDGDNKIQVELGASGHIPLNDYNYKSDFKNKIIEMYGNDVLGEDIFSYIYAILFSNQYRRVFLDQLKFDYPKIPFFDKKTFRMLAKLGHELIKYHTFELKHRIGEFHGKRWSVDNGFPKLEAGKIKINNNAYFENIPNNVYRFDVGGRKVLVDLLKKRGCEGYGNVQRFCETAGAIQKTLEIQEKIDKIVKTKIQ